MRIVFGAKNDERERPIPLNGAALEHATWMLDRWKRLGGLYDDQFLLPQRAPRRGEPPDFSKPMTSIKTAWYAIAEEAKLPTRIYDCRVTAITKVLKSGKVSIHTAKKLFGHVSEAMQRRYYKPQIDILREAVEVLERSK